MLKDLIAATEKIRATRPLLHCITNYVTANPCANALLALGASPIMADEIQEVAEITAKSSALVLNIGTLNERTVNAMIAAGKCANDHKIPVVFDPVGAGISAYRNAVIAQMLSTIRLSIIRGNISEMSFIAGLSSVAKGVDVADNDRCRNCEEIATAVARRIKCVAVVTGQRDCVADGQKTVSVLNDTPILERITGTGCMLTALIGGFAAVTEPFTAGLAGVAAMNIAGEIANETRATSGTGSIATAIIDEISRLTPDKFSRLKLHS